jgi:hypothetical protein
MFTLNITNNYFQQVAGSFVPHQGDGYQVWPVGPNGGKASIPGLGNFEVSVPNMGSVLLIDLGDVKLPQYTNPNLPWTEQTWGGLIRYRSEDAYFRYEGGGVVNMVIDRYGTVDVSFPQGGMLVSLNELVVS